MKNEKKTRREALSIIGKTGLFLGAVPVFFTSLKVTAADETGMTENPPVVPQIRTADISEKAYISGTGSSLTVKVSGKPGRVFYVTMAAADIRENYRRIPGSDGVINARGIGSITIDIRNIPISRVFLKVITGEPDNLKTRLGETQPVILSLQNGVLNKFEGTTERPILGTTITSSQVLIAMAASSSENKIILR